MLSDSSKYQEESFQECFFVGLQFVQRSLIYTHFKQKGEEHVHFFKFPSISFSLDKEQP